MHELPIHKRPVEHRGCGRALFSCVHMPDSGLPELYACMFRSGSYVYEAACVCSVYNRLVLVRY